MIPILELRRYVAGGILLLVLNIGSVSMALAEQAKEWVIGNRFLELRLREETGQIRAIQLVNRLAHQNHPLSGDDFSLELANGSLLRSSDFTLEKVTQKKTPEGKELRAHLVQIAGNSEVDIVYELRDDSYFLRRRLEFHPSEPTLLGSVDVWEVSIAGNCTSQESGPPEYLRDNVWGVEGKQGFGLPVFLEDTFWGLEFPAGYNRYESGRVLLRHHPGRTATGVFVSKTAVAGVGEPAQVASRFQTYIQRSRGRPIPRMVQIDYNTWTTLMPATSSNCVQLIDVFRKNLFEPYHAYFDSFTPDDGWDNKQSLWAVRTDSFPEGFVPLTKALKPMGTQIGLWLSPSSGYEHAGWGAKQGYLPNATFNWFLCQSAPEYRREMNRVVPELIRHNEIGFFKMDGFCASCDTNTHPQHLDGDFAREANVDALIELTTAMRREQPTVHLNPTSGMWASPWWLWYVDTLWCDTYDGTAPAIVPTPNGLDGATTIRDALLRRRIAQNPGFDPAAFETLGVYLDPTLAIQPETFFQNWPDNAMMVAGRGSRLLTFYFNPAQFPSPAKDWPFLAGLIEWTRNHAATLANTRLILGDPYRGEPYGYAHFGAGTGILTLRNPFMTPQPVRITLNETCGWTAQTAGTGVHRARIVYPYEETLVQPLKFGETLRLELQPYQTVLIEIAPDAPSIPTLAGIRSREIHRSGNRITWEVFSTPGAEILASLRSRIKPREISFNEQSIRGRRTGANETLKFKFPGESESRHAAFTPFPFQPDGNGSHAVLGKSHLTIPPDTTASLYVLCMNPTPTNASFGCHATINGKAVPVRDITSPPRERIPARTLRELPMTDWLFFQIDVPGGDSDIEVRVDSGSKISQGVNAELGCWLWMEQSLKRGIVTADFSEPVGEQPSNSLPFPTGMEVERRVVSLHALGRVQIP
jgi:hypothetical protein